MLHMFRNTSIDVIRAHDQARHDEGPQRGLVWLEPSRSVVSVHGEMRGAGPGPGGLREKAQRCAYCHRFVGSHWRALNK